MEQHPDARLTPRGRLARPRAGQRPLEGVHGAGSSCLHHVVDDFSHIAYAELFPDEHAGEPRHAALAEDDTELPHSVQCGLRFDRVPNVGVRGRFPDRGKREAVIA